MRKLTALLLALVLALTAVPALAAPTPVEELCGAIAVLMDFHEQVYAVRQRSLEAVERFLAARDYPTLVEARIVCHESLRALEAIPLPALEMSDAAFLNLMGRGVDTATLEVYYEDPKLYIDTATIEIANQRDMLYVDVYFVEEQQSIVTAVEGDARRLRLECGNDALVINALLQPLKGDAAADALWAEVKTRWPMIGQQQKDWLSEEQAIGDAFAETIAGFEALEDAASAALGEQTYELERYEADILAGDLEAQRARIVPIDGMPPALPLPLSGWLLPWTMEVHADADRTGLPETLILRDVNVTPAMVFDYAGQLVGAGAWLYERSGSDEEGWKVVVVYAGHVLLIRWYPDGSVMLGYDPRELSLEAPVYVTYTR